MRIFSISLVSVLIGAVIGSLVTSKIKNSHHHADDSAWELITSDASIKSTTGDLKKDFLSYDTETQTIRTTNWMRSIIAWKSDSFVNIIAFDGTRTGAYLIRIDSATKKVIYCVSIYGLGAIEHSQYRNSISAFRRGDLLRIHGDESGGIYDEIRSLSSGKLIYINQLPDDKWIDTVAGRVEIR